MARGSGAPFEHHNVTKEFCETSLEQFFSSSLPSLTQGSLLFPKNIFFSCRKKDFLKEKMDFTREKMAFLRKMNFPRERKIYFLRGKSLLPLATGTQFCPKWGPNFESDGDLMGTFASRNGDPKSIFLKIDRKSQFREIQRKKIMKQIFTD